MNTLQIAAQSPWWLHAGAALILFLHIAGGTIAMLAGAAALALRKGGRPHRLSGHIFFGSMLVMAAIGAIVSPLLSPVEGDPRWFDSLAGAFAFYLAATGWATVRRKPGTTGRFEIAALLFVLSIAAAAAAFGSMAAGRPSGSIAGYGASGYYVFATLFALAAALDLNMIMRGGLSGVPRLSRHVWRMCLALFIALGAFFFGQQRVMPELVQGSPLLAIPPFATLGLMVFWLLRLRLARLFGRLTRRLRRQAPAIG